jgi:GNAT superfamily N-acetyltransferase
VLDVRAFRIEDQDDLAALFSSDPMVDRCWCMWFITRVNDFHPLGRDGNRAAFLDLATRSAQPVGLVAYRDGEPVGWCAAGPRDRYARILRSPTLRARDRTEDSVAWLVPCFYIRDDSRRSGAARALLAAAVELARDHGAPAIEGFPLAGHRSRSPGADYQTGVEPLFEALGFQPVHRPSDNRVIMRLELT